MYYYYFQAQMLTWYLGEQIVLFNRWLDFKKWFVFLLILSNCYNNEYEEYFKNLFLFLFYFKLGPIIYNIGFYILGHLNLFWNLSLLDLSDVNNWNNNSKVWKFICWHSYFKNYDYFTIKIGKELGIPPLYNYEYLNYPNPKSQLILDVCFDAYRAILNNGVTFTYHISSFKSEVLGVNTIGADPVLDGLILMNNGNPFYLRNYPYWYHNNDSYFDSGKIINLNRVRCRLLNLTDIHSKTIEMMRHLAWIKGRFNSLNDNPYESEKMEKWMEVTWLITTRDFIQKTYNAEQCNNIGHNKTPLLPYFNSHEPAYDESIFGYIWDFIQKNHNPNDILREYLEKYQAQQDALEAVGQAQILADIQGNGDQADASSLMDNLNANDDMS